MIGFRNGVSFKFSLLVVMALTAALLGPTSAQAQASNTTIKYSDTFPFSFFNECTGETVSGVVSLKGTVQETVDASGGYHFRFHEVFNGRAVGETSGTQYVGPQTDHQSYHVSSNGAVQETFTLNFRFISRGSADNILEQFLFHITVTPDGEVTSELDRVTVTCTG